MKLLIQRVTQASVNVEGEERARIGNGLLVLIGVEAGDTFKQAQKAAGKTVRLRLFEDEDGRADLDVGAVAGELLVVSQFTLCASVREGNRPSFASAAPPEQAESVYMEYVAELKRLKIPTQTGQFGAAMELLLINRGPFTLPLEIT